MLTGKLLAVCAWNPCQRTGVGAGAADEVIRGISSLYAELVQPNRTFRTAFIGKLLKKFDTACNLHSNARTDMR